MGSGGKRLSQLQWGFRSMSREALSIIAEKAIPHNGIREIHAHAAGSPIRQASREGSVVWVSPIFFATVDEDKRVRVNAGKLGFDHVGRVRKDRFPPPCFSGPFAVLSFYGMVKLKRRTSDREPMKCMNAAFCRSVKYYRYPLFLPDIAWIDNTVGRRLPRG